MIKTINDFSFENASNNIYSQKTKEYFTEVISSYFNNNNRAAIVTLYSVVINDILIKLEILFEIYSDAVAESILNEIKTFQIANPTSPDWEKDLIEKVKNRTSLIDNVDSAHILALKNDRHLCAHPVIDKDEKLYTPNKETVASHIRNMLESLFLKPPFFSKKILQNILTDIAEKNDILIDQENTEKYIIAKYLANLTPTVEVAIFRDLWKFIFRLNDEKSNANRIINYRTLYLLYKRNLTSCINKIKTEQEYFSNILDSTSTVNFLIRFLAENEFLYDDFRADVHLIIKNQVEKHTSSKTVAWFYNGTFPKHLEKLKSWIENNFDNISPYDSSGNAYQRLLEIGIVKGYKLEVADFIIWRYANSKNYNDADKVFTYLVQPFLDIFTLIQMKKLCSQANKNSQVYGRKRSEDDHEILKFFISSKFGKDIDLNKYKNIFQ